MKKILAICGSTRVSSSNLNLIYAIKELSSAYFDIKFFKDIALLPHFNPDDDNENVAESVKEFRKKIKNADGVLICTPEYAMGVPGTLKNAIDWIVSSCELSHKPTALITASSVGEKGHASLLETLKIIEAKITEETQLIIPFVKTKITGQEIIDKKTLAEVQCLLVAFQKLVLV